MSDWDYLPYNTSDWDYLPYNTSDWDYLPYNISDWDYLPYNMSDWDYLPYNISDWDYPPICTLVVYCIISISSSVKEELGLQDMLTDGRIHVQAVFEDLISGVLIADVYQTKAVKRMYELYHTP